MRAIASREPFPASWWGLRRQAAGGAAAQAAVGGPRKRALELADDDNRLAFEGRELYWLPSGGIRNSAPYLKPLEELVGPWTMRTKGTVEALAGKYFV